MFDELDLMSRQCFYFDICIKYHVDFRIKIAGLGGSD